MTRRGPSIAVSGLRFLSALALAAAACGGPQKLGATGVTCFRDDDCDAGLVCVAVKTGDSRRVCTNDPTALISMVEGPPIMAGANAGGAAGVAGAAPQAGAAGTPGAGMPSGGNGTAGDNTGGGGSGGKAGSAAGGTAGSAAGGKAGGAGSGTGGTDTAGSAGTATSGSGGTAPEGGAPP